MLTQHSIGASSLCDDSMKRRLTLQSARLEEFSLPTGSQTTFMELLRHSRSRWARSLHPSATHCFFLPSKPFRICSIC